MYLLLQYYISTVCSDCCHSARTEDAWWRSRGLSWQAPRSCVQGGGPASGRGEDKTLSLVV